MEEEKPVAVGSSFAQNMGTVLGGQAASVGLAFLTEVCFARLLGPGPRGQISLSMMAIALGVLVGGLGGEIPIILWTADRGKTLSRWIFAILVWGALGSSFAAILWSVAYAHLHGSSLRGVTPSLSFAVSLTIPLAVLFGYLTAFFSGQERFGLRASIGLAEAVASLLAFLLLILALGRTAEAAIWGNLMGIAIGVLTAVALAGNEFSRKNWGGISLDRELRGGLLAGLRGQIGNVAAFFNYRLDVFIVNYFLDPTQVGLYAVGVFASEALWQIPQAAAVALFPRTARTIDAGATEFTCLIVRQVFFLSCISAVALAIASPLAIPLVFGARFAPSVRVIWWILPGTIAGAIAKVAAADLGGRYKLGYASGISLVAFVVTIGLDFLLIPRMGIAGAALASSAAYLVNGGLLLVALRHELRVSWAEFFVPSRNELARYKEILLRFAAWTRLSGAPL
jgi:O-antigen/teichoic acid export membrane protein